MAPPQLMSREGVGLPKNHLGAMDVCVKAAVVARIVLPDHQNHALLALELAERQLQLLAFNDMHLNPCDTNFSARRTSDVKRAATQP